MVFDCDYFRYWFGGIVGTCELIASADAFRRVWLQHEATITSIHYHDELLEQLLGDLHLEESVVQFGSALHELGALDAVRAFAGAVLDLEKAAREVTDLQNAEALLASRPWAQLQAAAGLVIELPAAKVYRTGREDIDLPGQHGSQSRD